MCLVNNIKLPLTSKQYLLNLILKEERQIMLKAEIMKKFLSLPEYFNNYSLFDKVSKVNTKSFKKTQNIYEKHHSAISVYSQKCTSILLCKKLEFSKSCITLQLFINATY